LFVYNLNGVIVLEKWKALNRESFPEWIDVVGRIECLNSLASFAFNHPEYHYPSPAAGQDLYITATQLAHPLIPAAENVSNDFSIGRNERLILVTGSNMSGKTTFLRTIGVNLLLAQCGAPVCAAAFSFTPMNLLTSLRVSDSLQEHTSYFMAELKKLQQIIHRLRSGGPALVLIDEILRGTNSEDKTYGSEQFIRKLLQYRCLALFATHDLSLGKLEEDQPGVISNYCFESVIEKDELHFNYQLQRGIARNRNASFLMQKMEII
jgi:DNA mismatch repair ATPase MutS